MLLLDGHATSRQVFTDRNYNGTSPEQDLYYTKLQ